MRGVISRVLGHIPTTLAQRNQVQAVVPQNKSKHNEENWDRNLTQYNHVSKQEEMKNLFSVFRDKATTSKEME